jgi:hypothetical protein
MAGRTPARASYARRASALLAAAIGIGGCLLTTPSATPPPSSQPPAVSAAPSVSTGASTPASASPVASGGALAPGTYARVTADGDGLRIRVSPKATATPIGALFVRDVVRIRADAGVSGGYHWYEVETVQTFNDQQLVGFVAGSRGDAIYLEAMSGPPSPTPVRSASPSANASASPSR